MPDDCPRSEFSNVDQRLIFPGPVRLSSAQVAAGINPPIGGQRGADRRGRAGRRPGHAVSRDLTIRTVNAALATRKRPGPIYKWWAARVLGVSVPTLYGMLKDYELEWPPPWPTEG